MRGNVQDIACGSFLQAESGGIFIEKKARRSEETGGAFNFGASRWD